MSKLSDFQIPKEVLENPGTSSVWFYQDPVSYTHLDVYKRQELTSVFPITGKM